MKNYIGAILLFLMMFPNAAFANEMDAKELIKKGNEQHDAGNSEEAVAFFTKAIEADPKNDVAYYSRGYEFLLMERYDEAIFDFDQVIWLRPDINWIYAVRGQAYMGKGDTARAMADFKRSGNEGLASRPQVTAEQLEISCAIENDDERRIDVCGQLINHSNSTETQIGLGYWNRGIAREKLGDYKKATADLMMAYRYMPSDKLKSQIIRLNQLLKN